MPLSAKKVAASYGSGGVRVPKAPLISCLTCPLCGELFKEATTVSECLHTFCRDCIQSRLSDGETNSCPICNVSLGTLPLEKLRADHQLDDVKEKIFPDFSRKRKSGPGSSPTVSTAPIRRKERSLYSLGVGAQPQAVNPGFAPRATRGSPGKSLAVRETSSSEEETVQEDDDDDGTDILEDQFEDEDDATEVEGSPEKEEANVSLDSSHGAKEADGEIRDDDEIHDMDFIPYRPSRAKEEPRRAPLRDAPPLAADRGPFLARRSVLTANGEVGRMRSSNGVESPTFVSELASSSAKGSASVEPGRVSNSNNFLETLAEVAEASGVTKLSRGEQARADQSTQLLNANDAPKSRDTTNEAKTKDVRSSPVVTSPPDNATLHPSPPRARRSSPQLQRNSAAKVSMQGHVERPGLAMLSAPANGADNPLPQLTSPYLRIKDGKLPVSHVKKYLVKKLGLTNETEVEITCRGQPVVSSLPLESVRNIWFATAPGPNAKDQDSQGHVANDNTTGLMHLDTSSAKELIMVLTYQRHRRNTRIC